MKCDARVKSVSKMLLLLLLLIIIIIIIINYKKQPYLAIRT